ncbi:MAG: HD domain-containing protein [Candidatus Omnitrophica bacterium]|nr:HD domain-containing protein [Candidatus Omnitrophota bacterium]
MKINTTKTVDELLTALSFIVDVEESVKYFHSWRVAIIADALAKRMAAKRRREIFFAALLHDVGGIGLTKHIVHFLKLENKTNQLILLSHPIIGAQFVSIIPKLNLCAKIILDHHEWYNGAGYPRGKSNNFISLGSQLIRAADTIDITLRTPRYANMRTLKTKLKESSDKEIEKNLARNAMRAIQQKNFLRSITDLSTITPLLYKIKNEVGPIPMPPREDIIGRTLEIMAQIIDLKHPFTAGHSLRVSRYAMAIALAMKLKHDDVTKIKWAGLIHDMGKLSVPRSILDKPSSLTKKEFLIIKKHPEMTREILKMVPTFSEISPIASEHHEYYNGSGYPFGLRAEESHLGARILTVCDAFDAMTSNRPYRNPLRAVAACTEIKKLAGIQFDPTIVKFALPIFRNLCL